MRLPTVGRARFTSVVPIIIALCLLAGCGSAGPTATPVRLAQTQAPPTATRIQPTATPVDPPPTPTSVPPTAMSALTATSAPTATPLPTATPTPEPTSGPTPRPGSFADSGQCLGTTPSQAVALGDVDADGDLDALVGNDGRSALWLNQDGVQEGAAGAFARSEQNLRSAAALDLADLDGDGDLDAFVVDGHGPARIWLNDGSGLFEDSGQRLDNTSGYALALGDLDGDGDLDALVGRHIANTVLFNDGNGVYADSGQRLGGFTTAGVGLADLDGDGDLDGVTGGWDEPAMLWFNDGSGFFARGDKDLSEATTHIHALTLGDLDGDGDSDIVLAAATGGSSEVWFNDGAGGLTRGEQGLPGSFSHGVALADLDGDGDLDAFFAQGAPAGSGNTVCLNNGGRQEGTPGTLGCGGPRLGDSCSAGIALGDLDGDGDADAFVANTVFSDPDVSSANIVWLNVTPP